MAIAPRQQILRPLKHLWHRRHGHPRPNAMTHVMPPATHPRVVRRAWHALALYTRPPVPASATRKVVSGIASWAIGAISLAQPLAALQVFPCRAVCRAGDAFPRVDATASHPVLPTRAVLTRCTLPFCAVPAPLSVHPGLAMTTVAAQVA
jgi:hypothetical protein